MIAKRKRLNIKRVTILDVAEQAGVSKSTVSRVLDERLPRSDSEMAKRVRKAAADLGYIRDVSAANLRRGQTGMIGVIVPRLSDSVMAIFYRVLQEAAATQGYFTIVATTDDNPEVARYAANTLIARGVDGLILATACIDDVLNPELKSRDVPYVLALRTDNKSHSAVGDDELGGYFATRYLIDLDHEKIALIAGPSYASNALQRRKGYEKALHEAEIRINPAYIINSSFSYEAGEDAAKKLMALDQPPTAILAVNDKTAIGALSTLTQLGYSVPEDISLLGYNDPPILSKLPVPLTSIHVPYEQIAKEALNLLLNEADNDQPIIKKIMPSLVPRKSTRKRRNR